MKMKVFNIVTLFFIALLISSFLLASCDTEVALGPPLNLDPPMVNIIKPETMENISDSILLIEGTAEDKYKIDIIMVSIECTNENIPQWKIEWRGVKGTWQLVSSTVSNYEGFTSTWEGDKNIVNWSITTTIPADAPEGEYIITAGAVNDVKNEGPLVQRRVTIDLTSPVVEIFIPELTPLKETLNNYNIRVPADLSKMNADNLKIQYKIDDQFTIETFTLVIKDELGTDRFSHYNPKASWNGIIELTKNDFNPPLPDGKTYLQIKTIATDKAGNPEDNAEEDHGWFIWWPDAVKPWAVGLGSADSAHPSYIYPGTVGYGQAYGKYGIDKVKYEIKSGAGFTVTEDSKEIENLPVQEGADKSTFFNFNLTVPAPDTRTDYRIDVTTKDIKGNETIDYFYIYSEPISNLGPLMLSYEGSPSDTYGIGQIIDITINLREPVLVNSGSTLTLDVGTANLHTGNGTSRITYRYIVQPGDDTDVLTILSINASSFTKPNGAALPSTDVFSVTGLPSLSFYTTIMIKTNIPVLLAGTGPTGGVYYNPATSILTLTYNKNIYKGTGEITLTQQGTYLAPAVLTKAQYEKFGGNTVLGNYYTRGTNGASTAGVPDTSEKYILNYSLNTNSSGVTNALQNTSNADKVIIPVASSAISINGAVMTIDLSETRGYVPNVRGVNYSIKYDEGFVIDTQNNKAAEQDGTRIFAVPGVNEPFIRVKRDNETIATSGSAETAQIQTIINSVTQTVVMTEGGSQSGSNWESVGRFMLTGQFIAYSQTNPPTGNGYDNTYINIQTLTEATAQFQGESFYRNSDSNRLTVAGWGVNAPAGWVRMDTGTGNAFERLQSPVWVSYYENLNNGNISIDNWNNTLVVINMWVQGVFSTNLAISGTRTFNNMTAIQPVTTEFKIDCQTPGADIKYTVKDVASEPFAGPFNMGNHARPAVSMPTAPTTTTGEEYDPEALPSLGDEDNLNGSIYGIIAIAWNETTESKPAYEVAARSVISFSNITEARFWSTGDNNLNSQSGASNKLQLWIRGGDNTEGQNSTPGFPLSWSTADRKGARLMTSPGNSSTDTGTWYWVSWNVNVPAYFQFLAGVTPATTGVQDIINNGPVRWSWSKNAWALQKREFVLYPGNSLVFTRNTRVSSPATENFEFYNSFSGSR